MERKKKFKAIARGITEYKEPFELTTNFRYFVKKTLGYNSNYHGLGLELFTLFIGLVYYFIPSSRYSRKIVYVPIVYIRCKSIFIGFLVHEILHLKFPMIPEDRINAMGREKMIKWRASQKR